MLTCELVLTGQKRRLSEQGLRDNHLELPFQGGRRVFDS